MTLHIAALASGVGSNVAAMLASIEAGRLDARIEAVLSDNPRAPVLDMARSKGVAVWARDFRELPNREAFDREMLDVIRAAGADTVALAGYMRMLGPAFVHAFPGRVLNVHPALLPSFPGLRGIADALSHGARFSGATVHFVDEEMDHGPVIIQAVVPAAAMDTEETLRPRIQAMERRIYSQALQWLAEGRLKLEGRRVHLLPGARPSVSLASEGSGSLGPWMTSPPLEGF